MCTSPLTYFRTGIYYKNKKGEICEKYLLGTSKNQTYDTYHLQELTKKLECTREEINKSKFIKQDVYTNAYILNNKIEIPCGKCLECRLNYAKTWANRCMLEKEKYKDNYFITLTYNNENLPKNGVNKEDIKKFLKLLRQHYQRKYKHQGIRFFICGEYGDHTARPHYHGIFFNLPIFDLKYFTNRNNQNYYLSEEIAKIWKKGQILIGNVTENSCGYVARYITKKRIGKNAKEYYEKLKINPEFLTMSTKPGIGREWIEENYKKVFNENNIIGKNGKIYNIPRYFKKIVKKIDYETYKNYNNKIDNEIDKDRQIKAITKFNDRIQTKLGIQKENNQNNLENKIKIRTKKLMRNKI